MKHLTFLAIVFTIMIHSGIAQESPAKKDSSAKTLHELGINATFFVSNFLTFSGNVPVSVDPYAFQYKALANGKDGFRLGFGANYRSFDQSEDGDVNKSWNSQINARLGYEHRTDVAKKWKVFFGADIVWAYQNATSEVNNGFQDVKIKDTNRTLGTGLVFGIQFFASKRVSMGTETSAQFLFTEFEEVTAISGNLPETESTKSELATFNFVLPTSIYINVALGKKK